MSIGGRLSQAVRLDQVANARFDEVMNQFLGINRTDGRCLDLIDQNQRMTAGQLAEQAGLTTGAVTALIDRLEAAGYLVRKRDEADRRKIWVELTPYTKTIVARIFGQFGEIGALMTSGFSKAELEAVLRYLTISASVNNERARLLELHLPDANAAPEDRLVEARAFERDTRAMTATIREARRKGRDVTPDLFED
ncbi:MAG: MarR family transcriptional regulator [Pelagibacterium sp.]|jgi:DNA-binding MarR family transcriptional regulator|uniref:MarR family winged helix-turn-helix transcriptional regulator n=1 Tax=Pelagibacterium sp. TaxID=1967288 RepID=UPI0032ECDCBC|tara:strand:- start:968 stop:1552 length:585 start_codon:yes stop_codon:yes gene_type:complete